ncbi:hypothetical protein AWV80_05920 [Cupriavidus sp. UYMU48A]|nr:hypothetical protein AWV80_05920 [Cupriavidus sp. UYMU48A]
MDGGVMLGMRRCFTGMAGGVPGMDGGVALGMRCCFAGMAGGVSGMDGGVALGGRCCFAGAAGDYFLSKRQEVGKRRVAAAGIHSTAAVAPATWTQSSVDSGSTLLRAVFPRGA